MHYVILGGPLVYKNKYLIGIVSFGSSDCGNRDHPCKSDHNFSNWVGIINSLTLAIKLLAAVFINVSYYNDWIVKGMKNSRMT